MMNKQEQAYFEQFSGEAEQPEYIIVVSGVSLKKLRELAYEETLKEWRRVLGLPTTQVIKISNMDTK